MADFVCHYILLISGFQNFVTRVTKNPATVTRQVVAATVNTLPVWSPVCSSSDLGLNATSCELDIEIQDA